MKKITFLFSICAGATVAFTALADPTIAPVDETYAHIAIFNPGEKALLCPSAETMMNARTAIFSGDLDAIIAVTNGEACLLGESGSWGMITAAHVYNYAQMQFSWLVATEIDTLQEVRLEYPKQPYWAYSFNLRDRAGNKVDPLLDNAFE